MGRELKKVFSNERTEKIMAQLYTSYLGYLVYKEDDVLSENEYKSIIESLWNSCEILMAAGGITPIFKQYVAAQEEEDDE